MAPQKKQKKTAKVKSKKATASRKKTATKKKAKTRASVKSAKRKAPRKSAPKKKPGAISEEREIKQEIRGRKLRTPETVSGAQSGDLQGLSWEEHADSQSVEELVEEGNIAEAAAVAGVEEADSEREVRTREVPEDDVPEEYIDKDGLE